MGKLIVTIQLVFTFISISSACFLIPDYEGDCFSIQGTEYITKNTSQFGPFIEGASVNPSGHMFAVNYGDSSTMFQLGQMYPEQKLIYADEIRSSLFNGIRFNSSTTAYVVDANNHRVLQITLNPDNIVEEAKVHCHDRQMIQPNDLTLSITGTVFTSGMRWIPNNSPIDGDIWSCVQNGPPQLLGLLGRTNGIEISPDEQFLYVSESMNRDSVPYMQKIWRYEVNAWEGTTESRILFVDFSQLDQTEMWDIDGMKTDIMGNLFVARYGGSQVAVFNPAGTHIATLRLHFPNPTNLEFGGEDGKTVFVVGQCSEEGSGCVDTFRVEFPGRSWSNLQMKL